MSLPQLPVMVMLALTDGSTDCAGRQHSTQR
jgi:hypothetical protein